MASFVMPEDERPVRQAYQALLVVYTLVPIVAGFDKFFDSLARWEAYLAPVLANALPIAPRYFMDLVGVVEIAAGVLVYLTPRLGSAVVAAWLWLIVVNLVLGGQYLDVALRDAALACGAVALTQLAAWHRDRLPT